MGSTDLNLAELIEAAKLPDNENAVLKLLDNIDNIDLQKLKDAAPQLELLCESWGDEISRNEDKANICVKLAEKNILDSEHFREALHAAVRKLLPPYLSSGSVVKAIGAKDESITVREAAMRLRKLQHLRSTAIVYQQDSHQWGKINGIDKVTGTIAVTSLDNTSVSSVPIANAVVTTLFFDTTPEMLNMLYPGKTSQRPSCDYRRIFTRYSLSEISDAKIHDCVRRLMVPDIMSVDAFNAWWEAAPAPVSTGKRAFWDSRSVLELYTLLQALGSADNIRLTEESAEKLQHLFEHLRKDMLPKDVSMLAECISLLSKANDGPVLAKMFAPLRGKAPFWPAQITSDIPLTALETWGKLSIKLLDGLITVTSLLYTDEEIAKLASLLPLRCIGPIFETLPENIVNDTIFSMKVFSSDIILWIWKNRTKVVPALKDAVDMNRVVTALSMNGLPKEWTAPQRELKKNLFEKADFQKFIINNADGDMGSIINGLQKYRKFQPGERQSLMVKLSRQSEELKDYLEGGEGRRLMGASASQPAVQTPVTSIKSHKRLVAELENLINVQIPENAAAVALARSYGDLRENAEYDAAKERRRFLQRRRSELEKTLSDIESTDFKNVVIQDHAVLGSLVKLESASGEKREYYLLGAWDGDPEQNRLSYKTKIGEAILDKKIGSEVQIPEGGIYILKEVLPLPEDLRKELADEK